MFGLFGKKKKPKGFKALPEARDLVKNLVGDAMTIYVGEVIGYLANLGGKTAEDVEKAKERMLECLQRYVQAEILLDRQNHGYEPSLAELVGLMISPSTCKASGSCAREPGSVEPDIGVKQPE